METYWDNYIKQRFSNNSKFCNLEIKKLYKYKSNPCSCFIGYGPDDNYIVRLLFFCKNNEFFMGIGKGESYYEAVPDTILPVTISKGELNDIVFLNGVKKNFLWKISSYYNLCE